MSQKGIKITSWVAIIDQKSAGKGGREKGRSEKAMNEKEKKWANQWGRESMY